MMLHGLMKESCSEVSINISSSRNQTDSSKDCEFKLGTSGQGGHEVDVSHKKCERNSISQIEDVDIETQFCCSAAFSDENDCMWLSSSSAPASFQSSDNLQSLDVLGIEFCYVLLYYQFSAMPPIFTGNVAFFDMDQSGLVSENPTEASLILERMQSCTGEGSNDNTFGYNGIKHSSMGNSDGVKSGYTSPCEDSPNVNSSRSVPGTHDKCSPVHDHDLDIINLWLPLLDLEGEESKWDADAFDALDQDFPSPSCHTHMNLQTRSSNFSYKQTSSQLLDIQPLIGSPNSLLSPSPKHMSDIPSKPKDSDVDEPLFWPFDQKSYWSTELEGIHLSISPSEDTLNIRGPTECHTSKSIQFRLHKRNDSSLDTKNIQQGQKGRIAFNSVSSQLLLADGKSIDLSTQISYDTDLASCTSGSIRLPPDKAPCRLSNKRVSGHHQSNSFRNKYDVNHKTLLGQYLLEFEADDFQIYLTGGFPIEAFVGLDEFDGHEGIETMAIGWHVEEIDEDTVTLEGLTC